MRCRFAAVSAALVLAGVEVSVEGVSWTLERLRAGSAALLSGGHALGGDGRFAVGALLLATGLALGALALLSRGAGAALAVVGDRCPRCGRETRRIRRTGWDRALSGTLGRELTRRRCEACGWTGLASPL